MAMEKLSYSEKKIKSLFVTIDINQIEINKILNISPEIKTLLEEYLGSVLQDKMLIVIFWYQMPKAWDAKVKIGKWDYTKLKFFCTASSTK